MKKVSIIVPVYNMGDTLEKCIESLTKQTYSNLELIIINDGSSDNTFNICTNLEKHYKILKAYHTENKGSGPARNYGIEKASGDYVYFMDADDTLHPNAIAILVKALQNVNADLIVFGYKKIDSTGKELSIKRYQEELLSGQYIRENYNLFFDMNFKRGIQGPPWNKFFKLNILKSNNVYYPSLKRHQDEVFISRYMNFASNVFFITDVLHTHVINNVKTRFEKFPLDYVDIVKELYNYRLQIMKKWNPNNTKLEALIYIEYIYNTIKAFDIIFSNKANMNKKQRIEWLKEHTLDIPIKRKIVEESGYNNKVKLQQILLFLYLIKKKKYNQLYYMLKLRVLMETKFSSLIQFIKKKMIIELRKN